MCGQLSLALLVALSGASLGLMKPKDAQVNSTCPTWTNYDASTNSCECGRTIGHIVSCVHVDGYPPIVSVLPGFCMTLNSDQTKAVLGACPFSVKNFPVTKQRHIVPNDTSELDVAVCSYTKRTGQLCGQCVNGTSPPVYSYYPQCVNCPVGTNNWAKYLAVSLLPTTLFFLGAVVIKFRATSPHMNGYIMLCQILASPIILRRIQGDNLFHSQGQTITKNIYISIISIWNLDFFRVVYPPFCLHSSASMLQVLSLDYITAAYPLVLIILTYTLVTLHYYNCRLVVWLWRPFLRCCIRFQRQWDIRNSLVDAFATFLLLSYVKLLSASVDILTPTISWDSTGERQPMILYYNGTVKYYSKEHWPYAILAITILLVFTVLPILLLCLYPCRCFQGVLNSCHLQSQTLHMFMDTFQGCYKDGTNGTKDCRYFAAIYLLARVAIHLSLALYFLSFTHSIQFAVLALLVLLLSSFHPYKEKFYNKLDVFFFLMVIVCTSSAWFLQNSPLSIKVNSDKVLLYMFAPVPIIYPLCLVLHNIWRKSETLQLATQKIRALFSRSERRQSWADSLPRRVTLEETSCLIKRDRHIL